MSDKIEYKIKHMELIQGIITRMASNSFSLKGWTVTIVTGIFILTAKDKLYSYFLISYTPTILFWFLDAYYLTLERRYRCLYRTVSMNTTCDLSFKLTPPKGNKQDKTLYIQSLFSLTEFGFYVPLAVLIVLIALPSPL
jgi:hypothetical protein